MAFIATPDSSRTSLRIIPESNVGVTPTGNAAVGYEFESTGESLSNNRETTTSQSFRGDRQVPSSVPTGETNSGAINFELKFGQAMDLLLAGALQGVWVDNTVTNGVDRHSFTIEKSFGGITTDGFERHRGAEVSEFSLALETGALITGSFGFMARGYTGANTTAITTLIPASSTQFMTATDSGVGLKINGVDYTDGLTQFNFSLNNNAREQRQIASVDLAGIGMGRSNLTGNITAYFSGTNALWSAYKAKQEVEVEISIPDTDGNVYKFTFHRLVLLTGTRNAGGLDQDVVLEMGFQAIKDDDGDEKTITIERIPA